MFKQLAVVISIFFKLRAANQNCLFGFVKMKRIFSDVFNPQSEMNFVTFFVLITSNSLNDVSLTKTNCCFLRYNADKIANLLSFFINFF